MKDFLTLFAKMYVAIMGAYFLGLYLSLDIGEINAFIVMLLVMAVLFNIFDL